MPKKTKNLAGHESLPSPVDVHVGSRIRLRRTLLGMSQERLSGALSITFQQVQKYERGANRVGASRLFDLSRVLASGHWPVAAIRREKGETFGFPGGPSFVWETADADLLGQMMAWSAEAPQAAIEIFNVTNGDVFAWRSVWPALADVLGVQPGADEPASLATYIRENANVWAKIVVKYGLASGDLRTLVGQAINMSISH